MAQPPLLAFPEGFHLDESGTLGTASQSDVRIKQPKMRSLHRGYYTLWFIYEFVSQML